MTRVAGGKVDRHLTGNRCAELIEQVGGDPFVTELGAQLLFKMPARLAEEDGAPRLRNGGGMRKILALLKRRSVCSCKRKMAVPSAVL